METTEILRILVEILVAGSAWYFKNKMTKSEEARTKEGKAYELSISNLKEKLTENKSLVKKSK